jgi:hypothetical protein
MVLASPTAKHTLVDGQVIALRTYVTPELWALQVAPPLDVVIIVPSLATAKHVVVLGQEIPVKVADCSRPDACSDHVAPPSVVTTTFGAAPTAMQTDVVAQLIAFISPKAFGDAERQPLPPLVVPTIIP